MSVQHSVLSLVSWPLETSFPAIMYLTRYHLTAADKSIVCHDVCSNYIMAVRCNWSHKIWMEQLTSLSNKLLGACCVSNGWLLCTSWGTINVRNVCDKFAVTYPSLSNGTVARHVFLYVYNSSYSASYIPCCSSALLIGKHSAHVSPLKICFVPLQL